MKFLIVIPARGKSKGIPKKNLRIMNGYPLIYYSIKNALSLKEDYDLDILTDTDDAEIAEVACMYGAEIIMRPEELSGDHITLDPVIYHALTEAEKQKGIRYDFVMTMQPTSPTLKIDSLKQAVKYFLETKADTLISVYNEPHLSWTKEENSFMPQYKERVNRQWLPPHYKETGGFLLTRRDYVSENSRIGKKISVFELSETEAVDIDSHLDWKLCESILKKKRIILRADGEERLGMGHIYRCLSIAYRLTGHDILFVTDEKYTLGLNKIKDSFFNFRTIRSCQDIFEIIKEFKPDIFINDILDTDAEYVSRLKEKVARVVNFEDKGTGIKYADCVINALYGGKPENNVYSGFEYYFIRDEFIQTPPKTFSRQVKNVVVLFGGSDPSDLTRKVYPILQEISQENSDMEFHIITGFGYQHKDEIKEDIRHHIFVHHDVKRVSSYMKQADLALTSQGRTIYECACMGVPAIVLAQNKRETEHVFASIVNGFINLGIGAEQDASAIKNTINWLIHTPSVRKEMHKLLISKDFKQGQDRVIKLILGEEI